MNRVAPTPAFLRRLVGLGPLAAAVGLAACGDDPFVVVTVSARPAVHDVARLRVTLGNGGTMRSDELALPDGQQLPATFTVTTPDRAGALAVQIEALTADGGLVGSGAGTATIGDLALAVRLEAADFVVNTAYPDDQYLALDFEASGLQLAATPDGTWTTVFRPSCASGEPCDMLARRFDAQARPLRSELVAGTSQFAVTSSQTTGVSTPAVAAGKDTTIALWDFDAPLGTAEGVACRALDKNGASAANQKSVGTDPGTDVVAGAALASGAFVVTWNAPISTVATVRAAIVGADCGTLVAAQTVSSSSDGHRATVAARPEGTLFGWVSGGTARVRSGSATGSLVGQDTLFAGPNGAQEVEHVRIAPMGDGFAVALRVASSTAAGPGAIWLYRTTLAGIQKGAPTLVTDRAGSDGPSVAGFGIATRGDGATLVVWSACDGNGDGNGCGVFGRVVRPTGVPVGEAFPIPTTTQGDQRNPSVAALPDGFAVAWTDASNQAPDTSGFAVRARVVYPPYDDAAGVLGARCGQADSTPCGEGLTCQAGGDGVARCYASCDPGGQPPLCPAGGACTTSGSGASCIF